MKRTLRIFLALAISLLLMVQITSAQNDTLTIFTRLNVPEEGAPDAEWFWLETARQELGINIEIEFATDNAEFAARLELMAAQGRYPDLVYINQGVTGGGINSLNQDALADWNIILDDLGAFLDRRINVSDEEDYIVDGKQFAFAEANRFTSDSRLITVIREDWLDALGLDVPVTIEDYTEVMRAFTEDDPDGNGVDDTFGLIAFAGPPSIISFAPLFGAFNGVEGSWGIREDELVYVPIRDERRQAITYINSLHNAGYIYPDNWYSATIDDYREARLSGRGGIIISDFCSLLCGANYATLLEASGDGSRWIDIAPPIGPNGHQIVTSTRSTPNRWLIGRQVEDDGRTEHVAAFLNWISTDGFNITRFGQENVNWAYDTEGNIGTLTPEGDAVPRPFGGEGFRSDTQAAILVGLGSSEELVFRYGQATEYSNGQTVRPYDALTANFERNFVNVNFIRDLPPTSDYFSSEQLNEFVYQNEMAFMSGQRSLEEWENYVLSIEVGFSIPEYLEFAQPFIDEASTSN